MTSSFLARLALAGSLLGGCSSPPPPAEEREPTTTPGTVVVTGRAPRASGGFASTVTFTPRAELNAPVPEEPALMDQYNTAFHPRVLLVRAGQKVAFKNSEDTLHNVHVVDTVTRETAFNVATPVTGSYDFVFPTAAVYDVSCGIHPSMAAFIVVTETPFAAVADNDGAFSVVLPPGTYDVLVWNLDPSRRSERVIAITGSDADLILDGMS